MHAILYAHVYALPAHAQSGAMMLRHAHAPCLYAHAAAVMPAPQDFDMPLILPAALLPR